MDILGQSAVLVAITSFALGSSVIVRNFRNKLYLAFAGVTLLVALWALFFFLERVYGGVFYRLHLTCNVWLAPAGIGMIRVLVRVKNRVSGRLRDLSILLACALTVVLFFGLDREYPWLAQTVYFAPVLVTVQILQLMWIDQRIKRGARLAPKAPTVGLVRRSIIYIGALLALATSTMDHVPFTGRVIPAIGNLVLCVYLYFVSQAVLQQRLLNFGALITRFLVLAGAALSLTAVYGLLVGWVADSPGLFLLNSFIASLTILLLMEPLRSVVRFMTQLFLAPEQRRLELAIRESQGRLAGIVDADELYDEILMTAANALSPERSAVFALRADGAVFQRARAWGGELKPAPGQKTVRELLATSPLLEECVRLKTKGELPILLDQILESESDRLASRKQRDSLNVVLQGLRALGCNLMIPLFDGNKAIAFVTLQAPKPPEPWGGNWSLLPILYPYFEQAALTLRSLEVFARAREKERLAELGEMAAGLAHEIRNPLGAIKGAAQFLDPDANRPDSKFLKIIVEETDRLNRVVSQFLDFSKPWRAELAVFDLGVLAQKTVDATRPGIPAGVGLEFRAPPLSIWVRGSAEQIQQILINLIQNGVKALDGKPNGTVRVEVGDSAREAHLSVTDDGPGIRRENLDKIFIPFFTTSPSGTGLGLSICQKIAEMHEGRIEVISEEGQGARFNVILPKRK